eukprot:CAMPEP_0117651480 /NCGR_PEP_ID=MMETSP0804-20121206/2115_1 /TAXON_ID=1074897 /ORGANISM="Tetraselmis astigmatica, Strain CCMP880" /LENGTH=238 /DNA_ID=CAMNT_0005457461 /DNA_START=236 /DNA_END=953 /DNA_ORIENTATION=+
MGKDAILEKYLYDSVHAADKPLRQHGPVSPRKAAATASYAASRVSSARSPTKGQKSATSVAASNSEWWKGPSSEAGESYPETAVTSRVAGSVTESELHYFMSKIGQLEAKMAQEKQRGKHLEEELQRLSRKPPGPPSPPTTTYGAKRATSQAGATAGIPTTVAQQRMTVQQIRQARQVDASGKVVGGWGYTTLDSVSGLKPANPGQSLGSSLHHAPTWATASRLSEQPPPKASSKEFI